MNGITADFSQVRNIIDRSEPVLAVAAKLEQQRNVKIKQLTGSARSVLLAGVWNLVRVPFLIVTSDDREVDNIHHDLSVLLGTEIVQSIMGVNKRRGLTNDGTIRYDEIDAVFSLSSEQPRIVVLAASALDARIPSVAQVSDNQMELHRGMKLAFNTVITHLAQNGFQRVDFVGKPGEMAVRGGILDIYPGGWNNPLRVEFWGDTVDSIREFEPLSQRSIREHDKALFLAKVFQEDESAGSTTILDHLPSNALVVLDGPEAIAAELHQASSALTLEQLSAWPAIQINPLGEADVLAQTQAQPALSGSVETLLKASEKLTKQHIALFIGADGVQNVKRLRDLCENIIDQIDEDGGSEAASYERSVAATHWQSAALSEGFVWTDLGIAVYAEHQIFGRQRNQRRSRRSESGITMRELQQLHVGGYVVHEDKGIGQFQGITTIEISGSKVDCVKLLFAGGDFLYVHLNYVHKLSKFAAEEGSIPKLSKLGTAEWERKKSRAKKRIKDIARDLIKLYAKRKSQTGFAFPADTVWQKELEASFQYEDTADQARTTAEVKADLEQSTPMDRLVCGDVGFGKTEIAIRAAFKAAQAGKQVVVLVPTTILAQQHFTTFVDRLRRYPVNIQVLSRFKNKAQQKQTLLELQKGSVDIVIGTHRLLSKDVEFRQLGLLIIDEEHRFGVSAKEKLRQLRTSVDTLTLTATPIPRTLNFSLMGARDLSVIETPPRNRLPIKTEIIEWDDDIIQQSLLDEIERGGQVFVVTDKIGDIEKLSMRIRMLVPTLRISVAHGQMETEQLEDAMDAFLERKNDVLIATKIIESGLDIPNANTILINNADNFGLAELYQLRGRVGRSNTQAYCLLLIPPVHTLSRVALQRLQALEEFTDLGSGFQLAMRDLEIRGAGNLLGGEQSGFIMEMGFELYQKILDEAVTELRTEEFAELFGKGSKQVSFENEDVAIELDEDALIPSTWIPSDTDRFDAYRKLYNATTSTEVDAVFADLRDRFGAPPVEAEALWFAVQLRIVAIPTGMTRVNLKATTLTVEFPPESNSLYYTDAFPSVIQAFTAMPNTHIQQHGKRLLGIVELARREQSLQTLQVLLPPSRNVDTIESESVLPE